MTDVKFLDMEKIHKMQKKMQKHIDALEKMGEKAGAMADVMEMEPDDSPMSLMEFDFIDVVANLNGAKQHLKESKDKMTELTGHFQNYLENVKEGNIIHWKDIGK